MFTMNEQTFKEVFSEFYKPLVYFCKGMIGDGDDSKDIVNDAFVSLWVGRENFFSHSETKAFLYITAKNKSRNYIRHMQVRQKTEKEIINISENYEDTILNRMIHSELLSRIYNLIENMPQKRKQVTIMCLTMKNNEVAEKLGVSVHTIKEHKGKGLSFLRLNKDLLK